MRAVPDSSYQDTLTLHVDIAATVKVYAILYSCNKSAGADFSSIYTASVHRPYSNSPIGLCVTLPSFDEYSADTLCPVIAQWIVSVAYGLAVMCDLITALALIFVLRRSRTGVKRYVRPSLLHNSSILTLALRAGLTRSWMHL